ncbi:hypothetical protein ACFYXS_14035 [Streptomyces sp. NPDC002574]|uniref:hypothetical protein n=1 Tax=Streptomyces sp. NPDC002574 TaxID=3364652 RepID=UPI0036B05088
MSLAVDVFTVDEHDELNVLDVPEGQSDLAGFESWRTAVWGSDAVRTLGTRFFPVLADGDLKVAPHQVGDFLRECALVRSSIELVAPSTDPAKSHAEYVRQISQRLKNIEEAARRAQSVSGGVIIW